MSQHSKHIPIQTLHLFPVLNKLLIEVLKSLQPHEWQLPTIAKLWSVKDIAAHLLDTNLRTLSASRDQHFLTPPVSIDTYTGLVAYLNELNADWVKAARRLSPEVITDLLQSTGKDYIDHLRTLDPFDRAVFSVAWAGEQESQNWFHIAREYTEKFLHQQQIREATGKPGLFSKELFYPFMDTLMRALPHTYRSVRAVEGSMVQIRITGEAGGTWNIEKTAAGWQLIQTPGPVPDATVLIDPQTAWKVFSKGMSPASALDIVKIIGDRDLGTTALQLIAFMA